ncbi:MAG: hypothetical protein QOJ93_1270, partial [Actinomycetota bacterium]|nr:hypothetical protein [Actinomycetota bacterium]
YLATGCEASCQNRLLVRPPGASHPVDTRVDSLPDPGIQPGSDGTIRQALAKCLCPCEQAMLLLRNEMNVLHTSIKARTTDTKTGVFEVW